MQSSIYTTIWSTLATLSDNHQEDLKKCDFHLCYIGRGLFMELVQREIPLQILEDMKNVQSLIVGELTPKEAKHTTAYCILDWALLEARTNTMTQN